MRVFAVVVVVAALAAGCGDTSAPTPAPEQTTSTAPPATPATTTTTTAPAGDPIVEWCASVDPDFCILGLGALAEDAGRRDCVFASADLPGLFDCLTAASGVTTTTQLAGGAEPSEQQIRAWRLAAQAEIERVLPLAHPGYLLGAGLVLSEPLALADALAVADRLGFPASGAWMALPVCVDGYATLGMGEMPVSVRFAFLDGEAEVARREAELTAGGSVITARHNFDAGSAALVQASDALRRPGVLVEAVAIQVAPGPVDELVADPQVQAVRLFQGTPHGALAPGDLSRQPPAC